MKHLKKLTALALTLVLCVILASCGGVVPSSHLTVDPVTGAGTAAFTMSVPKNGCEGIGNNFVVASGDNPNVNQGYITSPEALKTLIQSKVPQGFSVSMNEVTKMVDVEHDDGEIVPTDRGSYDYTVTFSFTSIDDYNAKVAAWLPEKYWNAAKELAGSEIKQATLTTEGEENNATVTLTADMRVLLVACQWVYEVISTDTTGAVIDGGSGFQYEYVYNMDKGSFALNLGDKEAKRAYTANKPELTVKATGVDLSKPADPTEAPTDPSNNPHTGDGVIAAALAALLLGGAGLAVTSRKREA